MKTFLFRTTVILNDPKFWIDQNILRPIYIKSTNVSDALLKYRLYAQDDAYISISENALNTKSGQFNELSNGDVVQTGYVIKGSTEIEDIRKYLDLWITIEEIINPFI